MKRISTQALKRALAKQGTGMSRQSPDVFWEDFKARARLYPQDQLATTSWQAVPWPIYARACAALTVAAIAGWFFISGTSRPPEIIRSVEVLAPHTAVLILKDDQTDSTVLWITGMNPDDNHGDPI